MMDEKLLKGIQEAPIGADVPAEGILMEAVQKEPGPVLTKLAKLIDVKSIVTLLVVIGFLYGFITGTIEPKDYFTAVLMVLSFYFGTQSVKTAGTKA